MFGLILFIFQFTVLKDMGCFPVSAITNYTCSVQSPILHKSIEKWGCQDRFCSDINIPTSYFMSAKSVVDSPLPTKISIILNPPSHTVLLQNHIQSNIYHHTKTGFISIQTGGWQTIACQQISRALWLQSGVQTEYNPITVNSSAWRAVRLVSSSPWSTVWSVRCSLKYSLITITSSPGSTVT
jgi:hypothetical protein